MAFGSARPRRRRLMRLLLDLCFQDGAQASACRVVARITRMHTGSRFSPWANGGNGELVAIFAANAFGGGAGAHAPNKRCIFDMILSLRILM